MLKVRTETQVAFTCLNLTVEIPEECVKSLFKFNNKDTRTLD